MRSLKLIPLKKKNTEKNFSLLGILRNATERVCGNGDTRIWRAFDSLVTMRDVRYFNCIVHSKHYVKLRKVLGNEFFNFKTFSRSLTAFEV